MEGLPAKVEMSSSENAQLYQTLLTSYTSVCGQHGREIFESHVLPDAFSCIGYDHNRLTAAVQEVIEQAGDCTISELDACLLNVTFKHMKNDLEERSHSSPKKRGPRTTSDLLRELEARVAVHNAYFAGGRNHITNVF